MSRHNLHIRMHPRCALTTMRHSHKPLVEGSRRPIAKLGPLKPAIAPEQVWLCQPTWHKKNCPAGKIKDHDLKTGTSAERSNAFSSPRLPVFRSFPPVPATGTCTHNATLSYIATRARGDISCIETL